MKLDKLKFVLIAGVFIVGLSSCLKHKSIAPVEVEEVDTSSFPCGDTVFFGAEIMSEILTPSCNTSGCHSSSSASGGYDLSNYNEVNSNANIILDVINHNSGVTAMPLGGNKLNDSLISKFDCWIQQGKLNN